MSEQPQTPDKLTGEVHGSGDSLRALLGAGVVVALGLGLWRYCAPESFQEFMNAIVHARDRTASLLQDMGLLQVPEDAGGMRIPGAPGGAEMPDPSLFPPPNTLDGIPVNPNDWKQAP